MLCEITIPKTFDYASKMVALTGAIKTVCLAAADSTPSYEARSTYNDTSGTTTEIITHVIDNTVAGGWTLVEQNIQNLPTSNWSSQSASHPNIKLRQASGSSDTNIPYFFFAIAGLCSANSGARLSNQNAFVRWGYGTSTTMQDSNTSGNYSVDQFIRSHSTQKNSSYVGAMFLDSTDDNPGYNVFALDQTSYDIKYYISSGDGYFTIIAPGYDYQGAHYGHNYGGQFFHIGKRTTHSWETAAASSHTPWTVIYQGHKYGTLAQTQTGGVWSRMQLLNWTSGTVTNAAMYDYSQAAMGGNNVNPVNGVWSDSTTLDYYNLAHYRQYSGYVGGTSSVSSYFGNTTVLQQTNTTSTSSGTQYTTYRNQTYHHRWPVIENAMSGGYERSTNLNNASNAWSYDANSSTVVPGVYPMRIEAATSNNNLINYGNHLKHMYHAGVVPVSAITNYLTQYALFTINGEKYLPVGLGGTATSHYHDYYWIKA